MEVLTHLEDCDPMMTYLLEHQYCDASLSFKLLLLLICIWLRFIWNKTRQIVDMAVMTTV